MIVGIGVDIFDVARMERELARHPGGFQEELFTPEEIVYCEAQRHPAPHYAVRFAAKEALVKALWGAHLDFGSWREVEVRHDSTGRSHLLLHGRLEDVAAALRVDRMLLSLSHTREWAVASVVLESSEARAESVTYPC